MGMICTMQALLARQIAALSAEPKLASDIAVVAPQRARESAIQEALNRLPPDQRAQALSQMQASMASFPGAKEAKARLEAAQARIARLGELAAALDIGKLWHVMHFVLTGHVDASDAPGNALLSGRPIGGDVGYGSPRLHDPGAIREFADFLDRQSLERLVGRVDVREMEHLGVYAVGPRATDEDAISLREEIAYRFPRLKAFVDHAANEGSGLLIWIS